MTSSPEGRQEAAVAVKALAWGEERRVPDAAWSETMLRQHIGHHNLGPFAGSYSIQEMEPDGAWGWWNTWTAERYPDGVEPTMEAATAAAQADFEARIRSALIPAKPAVEVVEARTVAWLIERKDNAVFQRPHWYHEEPSGWHWWTPFAYEAKRFSSKAEAGAFPAYQMIARDPAISITEHVFLAALQPATPGALPASKEAEAEDLADAIVNFVADWAAEDDEDTMRRDLEQMFKRFGALSTAIPAGDGVTTGMVLVLWADAGGWVKDLGLEQGKRMMIREEDFWDFIRALSTASTTGKG